MNYYQPSQWEHVKDKKELHHVKELSNKLNIEKAKKSQLLIGILSKNQLHCVVGGKVH